MIQPVDMKKVMKLIQKVDQVPKDKMLVMYVHKQITVEEMTQIRRVVETIRENDDVSILVLPENELELTMLTRNRRDRLIQTLQGINAREDMGTDSDVLS